MSAHNDARITVRIDRELKKEADSLFQGMGMSLSTAVKLFVRKAVDIRAIPFPVSASNAFIGQGYSPEDITALFETGVKEEIAHHQKSGFPVAKYDSVRKQAYLEYADGKREYTSA